MRSMLIGCALALLASPGRLPASEQELTPPEAYQPTASKNWWYLNGHLGDPGSGDPRWSFMVTFDMEHGGDVAGHVLLFTLLEHGDGTTRVAASLPGVIVPALDRYGASFASAEGSASVSRDPASGSWELAVELADGTRLRLDFESSYDPRIRRGYREGQGTGNIIFWNQATLAGELGRGGVTRSLEGVGFVEHVWGTWSRIPQKGVDYLNLHLEPVGTTGLPLWGSVYFRRTFFHGGPNTGPYAADVGPILLFTRDGKSWLEATTIACFALLDGGSSIPCADLRQGHPRRIDIRAGLDDGSTLELEIESIAEVTLELGGGAGEVHEGAAAIAGRLLPANAPPIELEGIGETEFQRFAPFYPY